LNLLDQQKKLSAEETAKMLGSHTSPWPRDIVIAAIDLLSYDRLLQEAGA